MVGDLKTRRRNCPSEEGFMLVAVIFLLFLLILSLSVALPKVRENIQRDRDLETMQRGKQYVRAIQLYYRKFHAYPPNIDALVKTNNIRFLRKRYIDPTTGKDDWKPVLFGQNKTPTAMGFFGQPMAGSTLAGTGPGGGNGLNGTGLNGSSGIGGTSTPGGSGSPFGGSGSSFGGSSGSTFSLGSSNSGSSSAGGSSSSGTSSSGTASSGTTSSGTDSSASSGSTSGPGGQTFGGAGIIGFSPASPKQSVLIFKKKNHYNEWEFTYDPISDQKMMTGGNTGTVGQPGVGTNNPFGTLNNGPQTNGGFGSGSGGNSPVTPPTDPTIPTSSSPQP